MAFRRFGVRAIVLLSAFAVALALTMASGAAGSSFAAFDDEPSHLVSSLMVRDWVASGFPEPLGFARAYYVHYPKVTIGQWPPGLPALLGVWMLVLGTSSIAVLAFFCLVAAVLATIVFEAIREECGDWLAGLAALVLLLVPLVQEMTHVAMTEMPLALWCTAAVVAFGRFLERRRVRDAALFAVFASLGLLTKGSAIFLAFVPLLAIPMSRRWDVLKHRALYWSGVAVGVLCGPWYVYTLDTSLTTWGEPPDSSLQYARDALPYYLRELTRMGGAGLTVLAALGIVAVLVRRARSGTWSAVCAWLPSLLACYVLLPTGLEPRHLAVLAPVWVMLAALGAHWLASSIPPLRVRGSLGAGAVLAIAFAPAFGRPTKLERGFTTLANDLTAHEELRDVVFLIVSDPKGEGGFIGAMAQRDRTLGHTVLRGSKVLGKSDWVGREYTCRFDSSTDMRAWMLEVPVGLVILDRSTPERYWRRHHELLVETLGRPDSPWKLDERRDVTRAGAAFPEAAEVYRLAPEHLRPARALTFEEVSGRPFGAGP